MNDNKVTCPVCSTFCELETENAPLDPGCSLCEGQGEVPESLSCKYLRHRKVTTLFCGGFLMAVLGLFFAGGKFTGDMFELNSQVTSLLGLMVGIVFLVLFSMVWLARKTVPE